MVYIIHILYYIIYYISYIIYTLYYNIYIIYYTLCIIYKYYIIYCILYVIFNIYLYIIYITHIQYNNSPEFHTTSSSRPILVEVWDPHETPLAATWREELELGDTQHPKGWLNIMGNDKIYMYNIYVYIYIP